MGLIGWVVVVNFFKEFVNVKYFFDKVQGLEDYFQVQGMGDCNWVEKVVFEVFENKKVLWVFLFEFLREQFELKGFFVINFWVYKILDVLGQEVFQDIWIVGFDLLLENIVYLKKGVIQFLIN